jgi:predicted Rossmann fold flavoprotein
MDTPGTKLLLSGSGQCNITHDGGIENFLSHYGVHGIFLKPALLAFSNRALVEFFTQHGLRMVTDENGKVFPKTRRSADVLELLISICNDCGVILYTGEPVNEIIRTNKLFEITTGRAVYRSTFLLIATGGASHPATGSTGDGYRLAAGMGHTITEIAPALTQLSIREFPFGDLCGISFSAMQFSVWRQGSKVFEKTGDILFTHKGLSGPGILDCSRSVRSGDIIRLSFVGARHRDRFAHEFIERIHAHGSRRIKSVLSSYNIPERLVRKIMVLCNIPSDCTCAHLSAPLRSQLIMHLSDFPLTVGVPGDFSVAMVTRGGVSLDEVNPKTMESRKVKNLFFAGEVLDVDGDTGGYNLQAAFSTGMLAARSIIKKTAL